MAPLWPSYIESGKTKGVLYVVDASRPETIGAATIYLIELLNQPGLESSQIMIVFTKSDMPSPRTLAEIKALMRLEQIVRMSKQVVKSEIFLTNESKKQDEEGGVKRIYDWCMRFCLPKNK